MAEPADRVATWRDGVLLTRQQKATLTAAQLEQYLADSEVRTWTRSS